MIGIKNGMVMQRNNNNVSEIFVKTSSEIRSAEFYGFINGRLSADKTGDGYKLTGIPAGGPYTVKIDEQTFTDIYVGDVWLLAGQSNMEGVGWLTQDDFDFSPKDDIRAFYMNDIWAPAKQRLHRPWEAVDRVHTNCLPLNPGPNREKRGVGPGLSFALQMQKYTSVPQGVICCAHGGTQLENWAPELAAQGTDKSLYAAMQRRFSACGSHVRGMFWYQGCGEAVHGYQNSFEQNMLNLISSVRRDFGADLPVIQVQIGNVVNVGDPTLEERWTIIREKQRKLSALIPLLDTVTAVDKQLDDMIHLSSISQAQLGPYAAESMHYLIYGKDQNNCMPAPAYKSHKIYEGVHTDYSIIEVEFENLHGSLVSKGFASGFEVSFDPSKLTHHIVCNVNLENNKALVRVARRPEHLKGAYLFYGYGLNPYCNITDEAGRGILAMGPVSL